MKSQAENELNAIASGILWMSGAAMILTPTNIYANLDTRILAVLFTAGIFCYLVALSVQRSFTKRATTAQDTLALVICGATLLILSAWFFHTGLYIEATIGLATGAIQIALASSVAGKIRHLHLLGMMIPLLGLVSGLSLMIKGSQYNGINLSGAQYPLAFSFLITAGMAAFHFIIHP